MSNVSLINGHDDETQCADYCGIHCVNGDCPKIENRQYRCDGCYLYKGCEDCCFKGNLDYCPKERRGKEE